MRNSERQRLLTRRTLENNRKKVRDVYFMFIMCFDRKTSADRYMEFMLDKSVNDSTLQIASVEEIGPWWKGPWSMVKFEGTYTASGACLSDIKRIAMAPIVTGEHEYRIWPIHLDAKIGPDYVVIKRRS